MTDEAKRIVAEETWEAWFDLATPERVEVCESNRAELLRQGFLPGFVVTKDMSGTECDGQELLRARIAACAPEALRMLLDNEWAGGGEPSGYCLDCGAPQSAQHSEHCRWMALMRKAGLR